MASDAGVASQKALGKFTQHSDIVLALAVVIIVGMMVVPLPSMLLDVLISINISLAITVLLVSMYTREPLEFSVYPSMLLILTLFRLALNISATRLILLHGHAGQVIESFGHFVVGGNYAVGVVVFVILVVIQFVVITNGAGRVAEVAARFTLDAMPGKQMAVDADLNAGLITENEARRRRRSVENEADFYGAMDGASKFVKGDAIAAVIIIIVNIIGGFVIGVLQLKMAPMEAVQTYILLTIGDGLVTQIPALLISTATGIIVTRAASQSNLGSDFARQLLANPRVLIIVAGILFLFALVPGLPKLPFLSVGGVIGATALIVQRTAKRPAADEGDEEEAAGVPRQTESVAELLHVDPLELEIGYSLIPLVDADQGGSLLNRIAIVRRQAALELGLVVPTIRVRDNMQLPPSTYVVKLRSVEISRGELMVNQFLAMGVDPSESELEGIKTVEPAFGLPAIWISAAQRERAEAMGYTIVDPLSVLATHLTEVIRAYAPLILSRQDVQSLLNGLREEYPVVVEELIPGLLSLGEVHRVLQNLLSERISIRDMVTILETLANYARLSRDVDILSEHARHALARSITAQYREHDGAIHAFTIGPDIEELVAGYLQQSEHGLAITIEPRAARAVLESLVKGTEKMVTAGYQPLFLCSSKVRLALRRLSERLPTNLVVLSYDELAPSTEVRSEGIALLDMKGPGIPAPDSGQLGTSPEAAMEDPDA
ncbi:MAG: flagellar biosynthesis protein FlhA [Chloroflexota bacterium]